MNLKHKMKAEGSLVDRTDGLSAVKTERTCQQLCHCELVGTCRYEIRVQL